MMLLSITLEVVATICHDHQMYVNIVIGNSCNKGIYYNVNMIS